MKPDPKRYYVYILRCVDGSLYAGYARDPVDRVRVHNTGKGSKYVRSRLPAELVWQQGPLTKAKAMSLEQILKRLSHLLKKELVDSGGALQ